MAGKSILSTLIYFVFILTGCNPEKADTILFNAEVYTMEEENPWATGVAIKGNKILAIFQEGEDHRRYTGPGTRLVDMHGQFVLPGFIDGHVHFNRAGSLITDINLMAVSDKEGLRNELNRVTQLVREEEWITGGLWGAYEQWSLGSMDSQGGSQIRWEPDRKMIDDLTERHPCFLNNFDHTMFLANRLALELAGIDKVTVEGMKTNEKGIPTGLIYAGSEAIDMIRGIIAPKSEERLLNENRAALKALREAGIVEIHDIARPDQTERFVTLQKSGELTCRVWLRPDLSRTDELKDKGITMGVHPETLEADTWLRYGALKGYIDGIMGTHGALFFQPYNDQPDNYGHYRRHTSDDEDFATGNMDKMYRLIKTGYEAGFVSNVHAIGTKGVSLMLDTYERLMKELNRPLEGFRVIHAQVIRAEDFPRFNDLNVIAEVNPYHISDDMRWMEERIGYERCRGAYAFKTLLENGALLSFGSDWPGTSAAEYHMHPKYLIHAAVNRTTLNHEPEGGWFPEEKISVHEALKAYTINNAYAAFEENTRGSIKAGKIADITVCDRNLLRIEPDEILDMEVVMTIVDGKIVYEK